MAQLNASVGDLAGNAAQAREAWTAAKAAGVNVFMCGEMAGDPKLTKLLLGMGLTNFSMHPTSMLTVKKQVLSSDPKKIKIKANKI